MFKILNTDFKQMFKKCFKFKTVHFLIVETPLCGYLGVKGCFKIRRRSLWGQSRVFAQQLVEQMFLRGPPWVSGRVESIFLSTFMHHRASFSSNMYGNLLFTMSTQLHYYYYYSSLHYFTTSSCLLFTTV